MGGSPPRTAQYTDYHTTIKVTDVAPTVSAESEPDRSAPATPFSLSGDSFTDPGYATPASSWNFTATINWGDGTTSVGTLDSDPGVRGDADHRDHHGGSHLFAPDKTYTVTVTVEDSDGEQGSGSFSVTVGAADRGGPGGPESDGRRPGSTFGLTQTTFTDTAAPTTRTRRRSTGATARRTQIASRPPHLRARPRPAISAVAGSHTYGYPGTYR